MNDMMAEWRMYAAHRRIRRRQHYPGLSALAMLLCSTLAAAQMPVPELGHTLTRLADPVTAPDFTLSDMDGKPHALHDYRDKVVMLNFWATWCPPCRREMPSMEAIHQDFKDKPFAVLAVNEWENPDLVFPWIGQLTLFPGFPILFDADGVVAGQYGIKGLPTTVIIDRQGRIVYRAVGGRDFDHPEVRRLILDLL
jgi:thiol-disulfide isomerase/thioredoxin